MTEYAAVLEVQQRGALHLHVIQTGRYIRQRELAEMAVAAGFGRCTDIREGKRIMGSETKGSAGYVTKQLTGYLSKQNAEALSAKTNQRRRPLRTSRGWGMSMERALRLLRDAVLEETGKDRDEGPFAYVQVLPGGEVLVRLDGEWERHPPPQDAGEHAAPPTDDNGAQPRRGGVTAEDGGGAAAQAAGLLPPREARG